jgi:hypothetical protein
LALLKKAKFMKTQAIHIVAIILLAGSMLFSCKNEKQDPCEGVAPSEIHHYQIKDEYKSKIPYSGTDTLTFISNAGDTAKLVGLGKATYEDLDSKTISHTSECGNSISSYNETIFIRFSGTSPDLKNIEYAVYVEGQNPPITYTLELVVDGRRTFHGADVANNEAQYSETVTIKGVNYTAAKLYGLTSGDTSTLVFYNFNYGIIKIKTVNGKSWLRES